MKTQLGKQTILFFSAQVLNALLGLATAYYLTSMLDATEWGRYTFLLSIVTIGSVVMDFGLNSAAKRLSAIAGETGERTVVASTLMFGLALGILFVAILAGFSLVLDSIFTNQSGSGAALLPILPFVLLYPAYENIQTLAQGMNRISLLSVTAFLPRAIFLAILLLCTGLVRIDASSALMVMYGSYAVTVIVGIFILLPSFRSIGDSLKLLITEIREFGIHLYFGRTIDGLTNGFDRLAITQFHGLQPTGYYGLAMTFTSPISIFGGALSASAFKRFAISDRIPRKVLITNMIGSVGSGVAITLVSFIVLQKFFMDKYSEVLPIIPFLAAGSVFVGLNIPYNYFLSAKRKGKTLRFISLITSGLNLVLCIVLIPVISVYGAACAYIATYTLNLVMNMYHYHRTVIEESASAAVRHQADG